MRRYKKKDIQTVAELLYVANASVIKTAKKNPQGTADVLVQCQEAAMLAGEHLETLGEECAPAVKILEEYCESIYQMVVAISDVNHLKKLSGLVTKQLLKFKHAVIYEMPEDKKEVVFLPYKASMWDSLESVWKAADADEHTDAFVIPVPYYDRNPDGSFRERHYEGNLYPDYVPVTYYDEYDFEERRPDVIYIHNPYDEANYVTSVEPFFYAKNLRQYTDKLVYIPYFILGEINPHDQAAVAGISHFCFVPGVIYAHKVIVQSENIRQIYISEYIREAKEHGLSGGHTDRAFLEKKILGPGSPKVDKVICSRKEDYL